MAISYYSNPIPEIIDGLLRGQEMGMRVRAAQRADQEFKTQQAMHNQQMSMQDIFNQQYLQEHARPVTDMGTVESPAGPSIPNTAPGMPASPGAPSYIRKADPSRTVKYGGRQYEFHTPEEQDQAKLEQQTRGQEALAQATARIQQQQQDSAIQLRGQPLPDEDAMTLGLPPGTRKLPEEIPKLRQQAQEIRRTQQEIQKGYMLPVPTGTTIYDTSPQQVPGAVAAPSAAAPGQPAIPMPSMNIPTQAPVDAYSALPASLRPQPGAARPGTAAPAATAAPSGMRVLATGGVPEPTGEFGTFLKAELMKRKLTYQSAMQNAPDVISKLTSDWDTRQKQNPELAAQMQSQRDFVQQMALRSAQDRETARQDRLSNQDRTALDRESTQHSKQFDEISKGADSQLDKILDAEKMVAGGAIQQALGIPKVLTALISGQGSGVRITKDEMGSIAKARGIGGDIEGFFNKISGQGSLTTQQKDQLQAILGDVRERILQKKAIARQASDEIMNAPNRAGVLSAVKKGRDALDAYSTQQGAPQKTLPTGHKVGDVVSVKGRNIKITAVHPDGSFDGDPVK